jgi:hypothetical protein
LGYFLPKDFLIDYLVGYLNVLRLYSLPFTLNYWSVRLHDAQRRRLVAGLVFEKRPTSYRNHLIKLNLKLF